MQFLKNFCYFWQFWLTNSCWYGQNNFNFSGKLPLIGIHAICKNEVDWAVFQVVTLRNIFCKTRTFGHFRHILTPNRWKCNSNKLKRTELLHLIMFVSNAKSFAIAILFLLIAFSGRTGKSFLGNFHQLFFLICVTKIGSPSLVTPANLLSLRPEISCVCE